MTITENAALKIACPSTVEHVGFHAAHHPNNIAIQLDGEAITYERFYNDIGKMVGALRMLGIQRGQMVGVETSNFYLQWLILLGFDALGVGTMSYPPTELKIMRDTLALMDLVMCSPSRVPDDTKRVHIIDQAWVNSINSFTPVIPIRPIDADPSTPLRIVNSSGTTGALMTMIQSRGVYEARLARRQSHIGFRTQSRYLVAMGFSVQTYHLDATTCIRAGGTCIYDDKTPLLSALSKYAITDILLLPKTLLTILDRIPETYNKPNGLRLEILGATISKPVHARAIKWLAEEVSESYGTNEAGMVCRMNPDGVGTVIPGIQVEAVDDDDQPVYGTPGYVRIKSSGCISDYLNAPEASRKMFRDGWFYPGDMAIMKDRRTLRLVGRADDLLNIRGIKYSPLELEKELKRELPIADMALTILDDNEGVPHVRVVIVPADTDSLSIVEKNLGTLLPPIFGKVLLVVAKEIPRTATGQIQRNKLNEILRQFQS